MVQTTAEAEAMMRALKARANDPSRHTDQADWASSTIAAPLSKGDEAATTLALGFELPEELLRIYREIGNGGYGPGYGILGVRGGYADDMGSTAVDLYLSFAKKDPEDPASEWPEQLLPICHWGCAIYSCVDCSTAAAEMFIWDPNVWEAGSDPSTAIRPVGYDLVSWLSAWINSVDLWSEMFGE